jgi:pantothenate kinase type III
MSHAQQRTSKRKKMLWGIDRMANLLAEEKRDGKPCCTTR